MRRINSLFSATITENIWICGEYSIYLPHILRRMRYIHHHKDWPAFHWDKLAIAEILMDLRFGHGKLLGRMESLGFNLQLEASLKTLTLDVLKSSEIEGEKLDTEQVRSSIARKLGLDIGGLIPSGRDVDGVVEMMLDATQKFHESITDKRLFKWHKSLFPTSASGMQKLVVGKWRNNPINDAMRVVSGAIGKEKVHFEAPPSDRLNAEMKLFCDWFNKQITIDAVLKAAIAHLWFVTIHPFDDGNGRIARAIADMQLARADETSQRFYSMSAQIRKERNQYYDILEETQKGDLDITGWLSWFLQCLGRSISATDKILSGVLTKARFWEQHAETSFNPRQTLMLNKILDGFDGKLTSSKWAKITKCSQDTALRDIENLIQKGVLIKDEGGGRSTGYLLKNL